MEKIWLLSAPVMHCIHDNFIFIWVWDFDLTQGSVYKYYNLGIATVACIHTISVQN